MVSFLPPSPRRTAASLGNSVVVLAAGIIGGFLAGAYVGPGWAAMSAVEFAPLIVGHGGGGSPLASAANPSYASADGWKTLHVFYGTNDHLASASSVPNKAKVALESQVQYFGEVGQDELVAKLLRAKRGGYFLDLAANDAVVASNTYGLETRYGWSGICVEAGSKYWLGLAHRSCHVAAAVVGNDREDVTFVNREKGGLSGIMGDGFANKVSPQGMGQTRRTVALEEILRRFNAPAVIDYFSLDVEGAEDMVLKPSVLLLYRFNILTIERPKQVLKDLLVKNGYVYLKEVATFGETLWAHSLALPELDLAGAGIDKIPTQTH
jgi:Methyltransferase FkbM domain